MHAWEKYQLMEHSSPTARNVRTTRWMLQNIGGQWGIEGRGACKQRHESHKK
jgi:hypothetical protein